MPLTEKQIAGPWTLFWDMHSGGGSKEKWDKIYIQAPEAEAKVIFYNRFGHNPERVSCTCCGSDYSITESADLTQASAYHRGCDNAYVNIATGEEVPEKEAWIPGKGCIPGVENRYIERADPRFSKQYVSLEDYVKEEGTEKWNGSARFIFADQIKPEERSGKVPEQGYVWVD